VLDDGIGDHGPTAARVFGRFRDPAPLRGSRSTKPTQKRRRPSERVVGRRAERDTVIQYVSWSETQIPSRRTAVEAGDVSGSFRHEGRASLVELMRACPTRTSGLVEGGTVCLTVELTNDVVD
jgi:hypothetical protein